MNNFLVSANFIFVNKNELVDKTGVKIQRTPETNFISKKVFIEMFKS